MERRRFEVAAIAGAEFLVGKIVLRASTE